MRQAATGIRLTAAYDPLSRMRVESVPERAGVVGGWGGLPYALRSAASGRQRGACFRTRIDRRRRWSAPGFLVLGRHSGATLTAVAGYRKVTAHYQLSYLLTLSTSPTGAGFLAARPGQRRRVLSGRELR